MEEEGPTTVTMVVAVPSIEVTTGVVVTGLEVVDVSALVEVVDEEVVEALLIEDV